jgi:hypothetical protein
MAAKRTGGRMFYCSEPYDSPVARGVRASGVVAETDDGVLRESFCDRGPLMYVSTLGRPEREAFMTIIYLIVAAVVVCGCLFFFMRARSRD